MFNYHVHSRVPVGIEVVLESGGKGLTSLPRLHVPAMIGTIFKPYIYWDQTGGQSTHRCVPLPSSCLATTPFKHL